MRGAERPTVGPGGLERAEKSSRARLPARSSSRRLYERLGIELADGTVLVDLFVHEGLGVARVVTLVVAVQPVADHVDHDVFVEALAELTARRPTRTHASGSSPFTWKIGACTVFATSVG